MKTVNFNTFVDDSFTCDCGNLPDTGGFHTCNKNGELMDPEKNSEWDNDYWCGGCGIVFHVLVSIGK